MYIRTFCRLCSLVILLISRKLVSRFTNFFTRPVIIIRVTRANQAIIKPKFNCKLRIGRNKLYVE